MRCNCEPKENRNRCGRRATQQVFAQHLRSGMVPGISLLIHISSEPLQKLWDWLCRRCSTSPLKHNLKPESPETSRSDPLLIYSFNDITDDCLSTSY